MTAEDCRWSNPTVLRGGPPTSVPPSSRHARTHSAEQNKYTDYVFTRFRRVGRIVTAAIYWHRGGRGLPSGTNRPLPFSRRRPETVGPGGGRIEGRSAQGVVPGADSLF